MKNFLLWNVGIILISTSMLIYHNGFHGTGYSALILGMILLLPLIKD